jgi:hypothetical protein
LSTLTIYVRSAQESASLIALQSHSLSQAIEQPQAIATRSSLQIAIARKDLAAIYDGLHDAGKAARFRNELEAAAESTGK